MAADLCRQAEPFCGDAANAECGNAQQKPQSRKGQADLSVEVQRHAAVVPDVPAHDQIVRHPNGEFQCRDQQCSAKALQQQRFRRCCRVKQIQPHRSRTAGERHGPVGVPAADDLQQTVDKRPQQEEPAEFVESDMQLQKITSCFVCMHKRSLCRMGENMRLEFPVQSDPFKFYFLEVSICEKVVF